MWPEDLRWAYIISERDLSFTFAKCYCPSVCRLSSVTLVRPTQAVEIFGNISTAFGILATQKILPRSSQGNSSVVKIWLDLLEELWSYGGFKLTGSGFTQIFSAP